MRPTTPLLAAWRERLARPMSDRESVVVGTLAVAYFVAALGVAFLLPWEGSVDPPAVALLVVLFALALRIHFEVGAGYVSSAQLVFVPLLFAVPLPLVPLLVPVGFAIDELRDLLTGRSHPHRWMNWLADSWFVLGPVLVLGLLAPGDPELGLAWIYVLALAAQAAIGVVAPVVRERVVGRIVLRDELRSAAAAYQVNVLLAPAGFVIAYGATQDPAWLVALAPLVGLLAALSRVHAARVDTLVDEHRDFWERFVADSRTLERCWAGSDVSEDWRCLPELSLAVAQELGLERTLRVDLALAARDAARRDAAPTPSPEPELTEEHGEPACHPLATERRVEVLSAFLRERLFAGRAEQVVAELPADRGLRRQAALVRSSGERWDGGGYPDGLRGEEIPLGSRIIACCEAYSAMTSGREYRSPMSRETTLEELRRAAGARFDPGVVQALERALEREELVTQWRPVAPSFVLRLNGLVSPGASD
jgi:HD domain-containing protein